MLSLLDSSQKARTKLKSDIRNTGLQVLSLRQKSSPSKKKKKDDEVEDLRRLKVVGSGELWKLSKLQN